jgi:hypothetical protein
MKYTTITNTRQNILLIGLLAVMTSGLSQLPLFEKSQAFELTFDNSQDFIMGVTDGFNSGVRDVELGYSYDDSVDTDESIPTAYGTGFIVGYGGGYISTYDAVHGDGAFLEDSLSDND